MANPVTYPFSTWQPDATGADSDHPITLVDPMNAGSSNDAAGWVRLLESNMRNQAVNKQWEYWLGINAPYSPSPNAPAYQSATSFTLTGDWTSASAGFYPIIAVVGRRIKAFTTAAPAPVGIVGTITAATFTLGQTLIAVTWDSGSLDASLSEVQFGVPIPGGAATPPTPATYTGTAASTGSYTTTLSTAGGATPATLTAILGAPILVLFTNANTGADTLNPNSLGAIAIQKAGAALVAGDIPANFWGLLEYDGTDFQLLNILATNIQGVAVSTTAASVGAMLQASSASAAAWTVPAHGQQLFTSNGTFTVPAGVYSFTVQCWGGGGGGGGLGTSNTNGGNGGNSSVVSGTTACSANGGGGGTGSAAGSTGDGGTGGNISGTVGTVKIPGGSGFNGRVNFGAGYGGAGGAAPRGDTNNPYSSANFYGGGGFGGGTSSSSANGAGGGGAGTYSQALVTTTPTTAYTVTVGTAGAAGTGGTSNGNAGSIGAVLFTW